jgi:hypothetical protein
VLTGGAYAPSVVSDLPDYAPSSTAIISAKDFAVGSTVQFQVLHVIDAGVDEVFGTLDDTLGDNTGSGHTPWIATDGGAGDFDNLANGFIQTTWYVHPDDSLGATFLVTATGIDIGADAVAGTADDSLTGEVASNSFTDSGGAYSLKWIAADPALNKAPYLPTYAKITPEMWLAAHSGIYPGTTTAGGPVTTGRAADPLAVDRNLLLSGLRPLFARSLLLRLRERGGIQCGERKRGREEPGWCEDTAMHGPGGSARPRCSLDAAGAESFPAEGRRGFSVS